MGSGVPGFGVKPGWGSRVWGRAFSFLFLLSFLFLMLFCSACAYAPRFKFFCDAALAYIKTWAARPNVLHCHDWPTAPVTYGDKGSACAIFTIHNMSYGADLIARAMQACKVATTVSRTYAREVHSASFQLHPQPLIASSQLHPQPIPRHPTPSHPIPPHPTPSHPIPPHPTPSRLIPPHPASSRPIPPHPTSSHPI